MNEVSVGTIVRVNKKGWEFWHSPPIGLTGIVVSVINSVCAVDFYGSGWYGGHSDVQSPHCISCWHLKFDQFDIVCKPIVANIKELFKEEL